MSIPRLGYVKISDSFAREAFTASGLSYRVTQGVPQGATLTGVIRDNERGETVFEFSHESFPEINPNSGRYHEIFIELNCERAEAK